MLKLTPVAAIVAVTFKGARGPIAEAGLGFSDWISAKQFRQDHLAETFSDSQIARFEDFPYNYYDVLDPEIGLGT